MSDTNRHFTALKIENFKRFKDFELENIGQFNLIVGKNNTGKTSLLEALLVDEDAATWVRHLALVIQMRRKDDFLKVSRTGYLKGRFKEIAGDDASIQVGQMSIKPVDLKEDYDNLSKIDRERIVLDKGGSPFIVKSEEVYTVVFEKDINDAIDKTDGFFPFIPYGLGYDRFLSEMYSNTIDVNVEWRTRFIQYLKLFIPTVEDVRYADEDILIFTAGKNFPRPLYTYGEGTTKLFRILCEIVMASGGRLMIDEIDAGIHYTKFQEFWNIVLQAAIQHDVQLFVTTHNEECMDYFVSALRDEQFAPHGSKGRVIQLYEGLEEQLCSRVYDFDAMLTAKQNNFEMRGGWL